MRLTVGFLVNPVAGLGGSVGLKGSDGEDIQRKAAERGGSPRAPQRAEAFFSALGEYASRVRWLTVAGEMGEELLPVPAEVVYTPEAPTTPEDTRTGARALQDNGADVLVFLGGDGTARDLYDALRTGLPVIGIPSGVKMHSGVFATSPRAGAEILQRLISGGLVASTWVEVRDVDESALREGRTGSRYYGELCVPEIAGFVQHTKIGGREDEDLALEEIVQGCLAALDDFDGALVLGPGGTMLALKHALGIEGTLLGVDVRDVSGEWHLDVGSERLEGLENARLVLSFGRGQGVLIGRGNQQLSPAFLRELDPRRDVLVAASRSKLAGLDGRPLLLDTGDTALDQAWAGLWKILVGFEDYLLYKVNRA